MRAECQLQVFCRDGDYNDILNQCTGFRGRGVFWLQKHESLEDLTLRAEVTDIGYVITRFQNFR